MIDRDRALIERAVAGLVEDRFNTEGLMEFSEREVSALLSAARDEGRAEGLGGEWVMVRREMIEKAIVSLTLAKATASLPAATPVGREWVSDLLSGAHNAYDALQAMIAPAPPTSQTQEG